MRAERAANRHKQGEHLLAGKLLLVSLALAIMPKALAQRSTSTLTDFAEKPGDNSTVVGPTRHFQLHTELLAPASHGIVLHGFVDQGTIQPGTFLRGHFDSGPIITVQRKGTSFCPADFQVLKPVLVQTITPDVEAQLTRVKPVLDANGEEAERQMAAELARAKLPNQANLVRERPTISSNANPELQANPSPQQLYSGVDLDKVSHQIDAELTNAKSQSNMRVFPSKLRSAPDMESVLEAEGMRARREIQAKSAQAEQQVDGYLALPQRAPAQDLSRELQGQLAYSKPRMDADSARADTEIEATFRRQTRAPADLTPDALSRESQDIISWDKWYARIAKLVEPRLLKAVERRGCPAGSNTVSITVWANHRLAASLIRGENSEFDAATLKAYSSLNGDASLEFPPGSRRQEVMFFVDNRHDTPGAASGVRSQSCKGDVEIRSH